jgi:hypothetical protein
MRVPDSGAQHNQDDQIRDRLKICLSLDELFSASTQQPDVRINSRNDLAIKIKDKAQNSVSRGVLRAEIYCEGSQTSRLF